MRKVMSTCPQLILDFVRNPKTNFNCHAVLTEIMSTCPQLILDFARNPKTTFSCQAALTKVMSTCPQLMIVLTRNVSMGHGCPRYCQIRINRALSLTKGHNSDNNQWILSVINLDLYFMTINMCMKYESNIPMYSKDFTRKPISHTEIKGHNSDNNWWILSLIALGLYFMIIYQCMKYESNSPMYSKDITRKPISHTEIKGHNSDNYWWILSVIELGLYFMIIYLCMKYESNSPMYSKDIARKPFFVPRSRAITLIVIGGFYP